MSGLPALSEADLHSRATAQSLARARTYFEEGNVYNLVWRDGLLAAEIQGSDYEPYVVTVQFVNGELCDATCTCPYDYDGDCKHIIATLLTLIHTPEEIKSRAPLAERLMPLTKEQMIDLFVQLVARHPEMDNEIELLLTKADVSTVSLPASTLPALDTTLLKRQIKAEVRASIDTGYDHFGGEAWYESDLGAALEPGLAQVRTRLAADDVRGALTLLVAISEAWDAGVDSLDEYFMEYFSEFAENYTQELGALWTEAILTAEMDESERLTLVETLDELSETIFGGESLQIALTAAEQGWDYPPLVAAMAGDITEQGAWEDEAPFFADELAQIRLEILERRGDYGAYLNLAQAEGQFMHYLHMLVKRGQSDLAVAEARKYLTSPKDIHALCRSLAEAGEHTHAIQLAQDGLKLAEERGKDELSAWLRDHAASHGELDLAVWASRQALTHEVSLENYVALSELAGTDWSTLKEEILAEVARSDDANGMVDIYLHEGMHGEAIAIVNEGKWFYDIDQIAEAVKETHPEWAFQQCKQRADAIMDAGRAKDYAVAAEYVRRGRDILLAAGMNKRWQDTIAQLMEIHERKYKLMPMLRALV